VSNKHNDFPWRRHGGGGCETHGNQLLCLKSKMAFVGFERNERFACGYIIIYIYVCTGWFEI
jgi:hypothetical protein